jgi:hypothetical protein
MPFLQTNKFSISFQFKKVIMKYLFISLILFAANKCAAQNVGIGTTTPIARLHVADSSVLFTGPIAVPATTTYLPPAQGAGTRMMWYPQKAAFRVGNALGNEWDFNNIGIGSFASGVGSKASGEGSTSMGYGSNASGDYSTAMGYFNLASGEGSTSMGYGSIASDNYSTAMGFVTTASGYSSTAMGYSTAASGSSSTAMGRNTTASSSFATAMGVSTAASGPGSTAMGNNTTASGSSSTAMGRNTTAKSYAEVAIDSNNTDYTPLSTTNWNVGDRLFTIGNGANNSATSDAMVVLKNGNTGLGTSTPTARLHVADSSVLFTGPATVPATTTYLPPAQGAGTRMMWYPQKAAFRAGTVDGSQWDFNDIGLNSFASGTNTTASGDYSTAMGFGTKASGVGSTAMGFGTKASGFGSTAMGLGITAKSFFETAIGSNNTDYTPLSETGWNVGDRLFTIGNGANFNAQSDAMVVLKNGNTGIGTSNPTYKLHIGNSNAGLRIEGPALSGSGGSALNIGGSGDVVVDAFGIVGGRFLIKENGNVGINKINPAYKLDVGGDINASGQVRVNGIALTSDARFKQNIITLPNALNNLLQLRGTNYFFNTNAFPERNFSTDKQMGVIAQEVEKVFPELVNTDKDGYKSVNYVGLIPVMIESIKELKKEIDELKQKIK